MDRGRNKIRIVAETPNIPHVLMEDTYDEYIGIHIAGTFARG